MHKIGKEHYPGYRCDTAENNNRLRGYTFELSDTTAIEASSFRRDLEALRGLGFETVSITHSTIDDRINFLERDESRWAVDAFRHLPNTEALIAEDLGGTLTLGVGVDHEGRSVVISFGAGDFQEHKTTDISEAVWAPLESIHSGYQALLETQNSPAQTQA